MKEHCVGVRELKASLSAVLREVKAGKTILITERGKSVAAVRAFSRNWPDLIRTRVTERLVKHASELAWIHDLRGCDSVQLATAAAWQQAIGRQVTLATFDARLWHATRLIGLLPFPYNVSDEENL